MYEQQLAAAVAPIAPLLSSAPAVSHSACNCCILPDQCHCQCRLLQCAVVLAGATSYLANASVATSGAAMPPKAVAKNQFLIAVHL